MIRKEPTAISLPSASRKPPDIDNLVYDYTEDYERMSRLAVAKQASDAIDEALRLQNETFNAKVSMFNNAMLDVGISAIQAVKGLIPVHSEPIEPYQPEPSYESMMLNAGYDAELPL